jgi:hypothetical protein
MRPILTSLVVLCALAFMPECALAWNYTGHRTIATIAYDELTPAVRAKVDAVLKAHPRYQKDLLGEMPEGFPEPERFAFAMAGYWPDIIRGQNNPMHFTHHKPSWHYINVRYQLPDWHPATAPSATTAPSTQPAASAGEPGDVVSAIAKNKADLRNSSLSDAEKAVAICWLAHLVGDIHQPLHAATMYSAQFPDGDRGGNLFIVSVRRQNQNLHSIWDEMLGIQQSQVMINYLAGSIRTDPNLSREALPQASKSDPEVWKQESNEIARAVAYRNGTLQGASADDVKRDPYMVVPTLPEDYIRTAEPVAIRRAALAGHRLADLLNAALGE